MARVSGHGLRNVSPLDEMMKLSEWLEHNIPEPILEEALFNVETPVETAIRLLTPINKKPSRARKQKQQH